MTTDQITIAIMGEDVPASYAQLDIEKLRFLPDNPRVYAAIKEMKGSNYLTPEEIQLRIYERLLLEPSVKNLIPEIKRDGGLQEAIIVRHDTEQVIEGNSRLAVYRKLHNENPDDEKWKIIGCYVVSTLTDDQQTRLLGQTHLHGKTEWSPYAKALYCYRWVEEQENDVKTLADLSGISATAINKNVMTIKLMQENDDNNLSNYSYYDVLVRNRVISRAIKEDRNLKDALLPLIKTESFTAQQMRDLLPAIIKKPKILRKFTNGSVLLKDAHERASISGAQNRLKKILDSLDDFEKKDIESLVRNDVRAIQQVVKKIRQRLTRVSKIVDDKLSRR